MAVGSCKAGGPEARGGLSWRTEVVEAGATVDAVGRIKTELIPVIRKEIHETFDRDPRFAGAL